jgi:membrane protein
MLLAVLTVAVSLRSASRPKGAATPSRPGAAAATPEAIPPRGWWAILKRAAFKFSDNELMSEAASVTFYALLAIFPAMAALISLYGLFADPKTIADHLDAVSGFVPGGGMDLIKEQVTRLTQNPPGSLGFGVLLGLATAIWSANQGSKAMFSALNDVYDEKEKRSFIKLTLITLGFTLGALVFLMTALGAVVVLPIALNFIGYTGSLDLAAELGRWPALLVLIGAFLAVLYRLGPSREPARWRWITWGSAFASLAWVALSIGFSWYVGHFGSYNKTYGSLGAVIGFMTWIWLSSTVILAGAQLNAEMEAQTTRDTTRGPERPMGIRGATKADRVA